MPTKPKVTDEQIIKLAREGKSNRAIAASNGISYTGKFNRRCNKIREANGIAPVKRGRPEGSGDSYKREKETSYRRPGQCAKMIPVKVTPPAEKIEPVPKTIISTGPNPTKPFPYDPGDEVYCKYRLCTVEHVFTDSIILRKNADKTLIKITMEEYVQNPEIISQIDEKPRVTTVGEAVVLKQRDEAKEYIQDAEIAETAKGFQPFDFEMDDNTDTTKEFGPLFTEENYIDPEWGMQQNPVSTVKDRVKSFAAKLFGEGKK